MRAILVGMLLGLFITNYAQTIGEDDIETGDLGFWVNGITESNGTVATSTGTVHSGLYSCAHTLTAATVDTRMRMPLTTSANPTYYRFWFRIASGLAISGDFTIFRVTDAAVSGGRRVYLTMSDENFRLKVEGGSTGSTNISLDAWHSVKLVYTSGEGTGAASVYLDGGESPESSASSLTIPVPALASLGTSGSVTTEGTLFYDTFLAAESDITTPAIGIRVRHPNTHARSAMMLHLVSWGISGTDKLVVTINDEEVYRKESGVSGVEGVPITLSTLATGDHTLEVVLQNAAGSELASSSESIHKYIDGTPTVSIDAYNNIYVGGQPTFPVTPFLHNTDGDGGDADMIETEFESGYVNRYGWASEYAETYNATQYGTFISEVASITGNGSIGPDNRWCSEDDSSTVFCADSTDNAGYITESSAYCTALKDDPNIFMWTWVDEPNSGGSTPRVSPVDVKAVTDACRAIDGNHPHALNLVGEDVAPDGPATTRLKGFLYPSLPAEVYAWDNYPAIYHRGSGISTMGEWADALDTYNSYTYNLVPWCVFVEGGTQIATSGSAINMGMGPSPEMVTMEAWMAVVHGYKCVSWWGPGDSFTSYSAGHQTARSGFVSDINAFQDVILSTPPAQTVSTNRTSSPQRVDAMLRGSGNSLYVFAVRLSDFNDFTPETGLTISVDGTAKTFSRSSGTWPAYVTVGSRVWFTGNNLQSANTRGYDVTDVTGGVITVEDPNDWLVTEADNAESTFNGYDPENPDDASSLLTQFAVSGLEGAYIATVYGESRSVQVVDGVFTDSFAPYARHIYQIIPMNAVQVSGYGSSAGAVQ